MAGVVVGGVAIVAAVNSNIRVFVQVGSHGSACAVRRNREAVSVRVQSVTYDPWMQVKSVSALVYRIISIIQWRTYFSCLRYDAFIFIYGAFVCSHDGSLLSKYLQILSQNCSERTTTVTTDSKAKWHAFFWFYTPSRELSVANVPWSTANVIHDPSERRQISM